MTDKFARESILNVQGMLRLVGQRNLPADQLETTLDELADCLVDAVKVMDEENAPAGKNLFDVWTRSEDGGPDTIVNVPLSEELMTNVSLDTARDFITGMTPAARGKYYALKSPERKWTPHKEAKTLEDGASAF